MRELLSKHQKFGLKDFRDLGFQRRSSPASVAARSLFVLLLFCSPEICHALEVGRFNIPAPSDVGYGVFNAATKRDEVLAWLDFVERSYLSG
jgi:hypothetical protein